MFDRFVLVWLCLFSLPFGVWDGLRFVIMALPGLSSYLVLYALCFSGEGVAIQVPVEKGKSITGTY